MSGPRSIRLKSIPPIMFLLLSGFFAASWVVPQVKAASSGVICISDPTLDPTDCPFSPANFTGNVGDTITVAVNIQRSDSFNAFDIALQANASILQPLSISLADSIFHEPRFIVLQSMDPNGVARLAVTALGYEARTPVTGNLFEVSFRVLSNDTTTIAYLQSSNNCTSPSVQGLCVSVVDGARGLIDETVQAASYGFLTPDFSLSANFPDTPFVPLYCSCRYLPAGSSSGATIRVNMWAGFDDPVNLSATVSMVIFSHDNTGLSSLFACPMANCPSVSFNSTIVIPYLYGAGWATLTIAAPPEEYNTPQTTWSVNITATSGGLSHSVRVFLFVEPPAVSITVSGPWNVKSGATVINTVALSSLGGFGMINLSITPRPVCIDSPCPSWSLSTTNTTLLLGGTAQTSITFTAPPEQVGAPITNWPISLTAMSGKNNLKTLELYFVIVPPFPVSFDPSTLVIARDQSGLAVIDLSESYYYGPVALSLPPFSLPPLSVSIVPNIKKAPSLTLGLIGCGEDCVNPALFIATNGTTHPGTYTITVTANNGFFTNSGTLTLIVVANDTPRHHSVPPIVLP